MRHYFFIADIAKHYISHGIPNKGLVVIHRLIKKFGAITFFGIAMGFLEAAVVVYLREIIYPEGFYFPLKAIPK